MSEFEFDFRQVQQAPETPQIRACCYGSVEILTGIAAAVSQGTAGPEAVMQKVSDATQRLPTTVTTQDAAELTAAFNGLRDAMASKTGFSEAQGAVAFSEAVVTLHVKAAVAGTHPTPQQSQELGELAMRLNTLAKDYVGSAGGIQVLSEVQARTEVFIKQAQEANPLFGLSMASAVTPEMKPHPSEPAAKAAWYETTKESPVEGKPSVAQELSKNVDNGYKERAPEPGKEAVNEVAKTARSEVNAEPYKRTSEAQADRVETVAQRQSAPVENSLVASVAKIASLPSSSPAPAPQQANVAPSPAAARSVSASPQSSAYSVSQNASDHAPSGGVASAAGRTGAGLSSSRVVTPSSTWSTATVQRVAQGRSSVASTPDRTGAGSSSARVVTPSAMRSAATVQRVAQGRSGDARVLLVSKNVTPLPGNRATGRTGQVVRPNSVKPPGEQLSQRAVRRAQPSAGVKVGRDKVASTISPEGRAVVTGRSVIASPVQRISAMLANLRALSPKELSTIKIERHGQPKDVQVALAIRARAQKIIERIKSLPLKDIVKIKGLRAETRMGKGGNERTALSAREMLARREVRLVIRDLSARLQGFLNPRSMLYKRVMTELTLSDLERIVSMLGGNRAVKGLRKKRKAGEVTQVFEADISNSFLSQLASAANGSSGVGGSGGSDEPAASPDGAGTEASTEASTEEATLVADGATPTATLSTFIMKEETVGNSMP